ncbi:class I SAM-dependent methyltransferase [Dyella sp.]|uniref:class I SAM-dependent methyltransferase n=1 Tax=Dyella sp. TaxID=1869338 RepID=UPI003F7E67C2
MKNQRTPLELHSGAYVEKYELKPTSRLEQLIPLMRLEAHDQIVDFACGNAMLLPLIHDMVKHYHGVDFSPDFIAAARRRAENEEIANCSFYCEDIVSFCEKRRAMFSVAASFDFSEHIDDADFVRLFRAIHLSLRPSGRLYLHTPNLKFFVERLKQFGILPQFPEHIAVRDAESTIALLARAGFDTGSVVLRRIPHYNILKVLHPLHHVPLLGELFAARLFIECRP